MSEETAEGASPSLFLISTANAKGGRTDLLERMIASVEAFSGANPHVRVNLMLLMQSSDGPGADFSRFTFVEVIDPVRL